MEVVNPLSSLSWSGPLDIHGVPMRGAVGKQWIEFSRHGWLAAKEDPTIDADKYGAMIRKSLRPLSEQTLALARGMYQRREVPELPYYVILESAGQICGRRCPHCTINVMVRHNQDGSIAKPGFMKWEHFMKLMEEYAEWGNGYGCSPYMLGEPLDYLVKDGAGQRRDMGDMVEAIKKVGKFRVANVSTHGDIPADRFFRMLDCDLDDLIVSIDGATPEVYSANRPVTSGTNEGAYERTVARVEAFLQEKVRRGASKPYCQIQIINKENTVNDIVPFILKWITTPGVDSVVIKNLDSMRPWLGTKLVSDEEDKIKAERTAGMACQHPFAVASMVYTGQFTLCCHDAFTELTDGSTIATSTFREWWHGAYITKMRADHSAGNYPPVCAACREKDTWLG